METSKKTGSNPILVHYSRMDDFTRGFNLGWLACAIDCEGGIGLRVLKMGKGKLGFALHPYVEIYNTDERLINKAKELALCGTMSVSYATQKKVHKPKRWFKILKQLDIIYFLEMIAPWLISKRERALLVIEFCKSRLAVREAKDFRKPRAGSTPYSKEELELAKRIRELVAKESGSSRQGHAWGL